MTLRVLGGAMLLVAFVSFSSFAAGPLDELAIDRWAKLREAERFQLNAAEKLYREKQYKAAADEYEKFLKLYERSEGAAFAQLKWAHCQVHLRHMNAAVKDGYQTVLDYFPETPEAPLAALLIGRTQKDMGDLKAAKKGYAKAISSHPKHFVAALARLDLVDIATIEKDVNRRAELLRELTYDVPRNGGMPKEAVRELAQAPRLLALHYFNIGDFDEGVKALETIYKEADLPTQMLDARNGPHLGNAIRDLIASKDPNQKSKGERLADAAVSWFKNKAATALADPAKKAETATYWYAAASVQHQAGRPDKQKEILDQMLKALGVSDSLLGKIAAWYKENNQREKARETYLKYQDAIEGQAQVAASYLEENQYDRAVETYRTLAAKDDKHNAKWMAQAALVYRTAKKPDLAIAVYRDLLTTDASNAANWQWETAETLYFAGRWKDAITNYRGTDRFPTNYDRMATAYRRLSQWDEAIALYRQIMAGSPPHASGALMDIGNTEEQAGRTELAIKTFKQICDKFPTSAEGSKAHAHLNQKYKITVTLGGAKD